MLQHDHNTAHRLAEQLKQDFPAAQISMDAAANTAGGCFLDIRYHDKFIVVEWREDRGFGISCAPELHFGEGPHEVYENPDAARARITSLLLSSEFTQGI